MTIYRKIMVAMTLALVMPIATPQAATLPISAPSGFVPGVAPYVAADGVNASPVSNANPVPVAIVSGSSGGGSSTPTGTAGAPNAAIVTVQGIAGATPIKVDGTATTQPISVAVLPLPTGAATAANQATGNSTLAAIQTALGSPLQAGGAVTVSNFPATQPVSASSLPLPAGAATSALQGAANTTLSAIQAAVSGATPAGTAHIGGVAVDDVADAATTSGSATSAAVVVSASTAGYAGGSFQITGIGGGNTIVFEQSNDNATWLPVLVQNGAASNASPVTSVTTSGLWTYNSQAAYVRARVSVYGSGTVSIMLAQKRIAAPITGVSLASNSNAVIGTVLVSGSVNGTSGYTDSSTALGASAVFTGTGRQSTSAASFFQAQAQADQAGTLYIEASYDSGATYYPLASAAAAAVTNAAGTTYYVASARVSTVGTMGSGTLYRLVYKNGATAQALFRAVSSFTAG